MPESLSVIIPNYNGADLLRKNVPKVIEAVKRLENVEIIVIDDASSDDSVFVLQSISQGNSAFIKILENKKNSGFSSTVNKAVKEAKGEIVLLLNTDVVPEKDFFVPLLEHFKDAEVFAVGCMDKSVEGNTVVLRGRGVGRWERGLLIHKRGEVNKKDTLWVSGGSAAFRKSMWESLGGFNTMYDPFYWEDIDLSYRAQKAGFRIIFEPKSIVAHEHTKGAILAKYSSFYIKMISYRNQFLFSWNNLTDANLLLEHFLWLPYHVIKAFLRSDAPFLFGFLLACLHIPSVVIWRTNHWQKVKTDKEVVEPYSV